MTREESRGLPDGLATPCGHPNAPDARFCEVCGIELITQCPRCATVIRRQVNFCNHCGLDLRDRRAAAPTAPVSPAPPTPSATASDPIQAAQAFRPAASDEGRDTPSSRDPLPWPVAGTSERIAGGIRRSERLDRIWRFDPQRRRRRLAWIWLGTMSVSVVLVLLGGTLLRAFIAMPGAPRPPLGDTAAQNVVVTPVTGSGSAAIVHPGASPSPPPDPTVPPAPPEGRPAATALEKSPAGGPAARAGGELTFVVPGEPPSYDAHREETFALIHPAAPHYNTLLRIDPFDRTGTRVVGDLATSWSVSSDRRTYVLRLRRGVKFHDGSEMTSRDVHATYEKIINPPAGITSARRGEYLQIETVQAPEPYVVAFKLKWPSPSFIHSLASPWNWIYKADILERDVRWYEKNIMGTGPFVFVEHVKGSHWVGRQNPAYWDRGKPYLDGYRALFIRDDAAQMSAVGSGRAHIQFRGFSPAQRDEIVRALGEKVIVQESPWNCGLVVAINHEKEPFRDRGVRRALSLALDRYRAAAALSKTAIVRDVAGVQVPGSPFATSPAELAKLAGYRRDIQESRSEARRLLAEAGVRAGFSFVLKNRDVPMPYHHLGTWLVEEWRRIGLQVRHEVQDSSQYFKDLRAGNFELSTDFQCGYVVDPDLDLYKFQSRGRSDANYGRYTDPELDDLYVRQSRTVDPEQRRRYIRTFERRLLDEEAHYIPTLQWHRIVVHSSRVRGWTITPSHYLNNQLDTVWLAE
jgi:peptide/nickel transport system substrate-binding protein